MTFANRQWKADPSWNADGTFNAAGHEADLARIPSRTEVGVDSVWEVAHDKYPGAWKVTKVNPRSIDLVNTTGGRLRADVGLLRRTGLEFVADTTAYRPRTGAVVTPVRDLGSRGPQKGTAYVVLKTVGLVEVSLAVLNGDGRHWPTIPCDLLEAYHGTVEL
jgi:hypothetical protein